DAARRIAAVLEHPRRPHEPRRSAAGAARVRRLADAADSLLRSAPRREAGTDGLGAGALHLRRHRRGRDREAAVRPVLHQEPVDRPRSIHRVRDGQDGSPPERPVTPPVINAMTIDVEDYFHVSVFDGLVPRHAWDGMESRVVANTERLLQIFDDADVQATFFVLGWVAERFPQLVR